MMINGIIATKEDRDYLKKLLLLTDIEYEIEIVDGIVNILIEY